MEALLFPELAGLLAIWLLAIVSPGPAFLVVSQSAVGRSRPTAFAVALPPHLPDGAKLVLLAAGFGLEIAWYSLVAFVLSTGGPRRLYNRARRTIDRVLGAVLLLAGVRIGVVDR